MWLSHSLALLNSTITRAISAASYAIIYPSPIPFAAILPKIIYTMIQTLIQIPLSILSLLFTNAEILLKVSLYILDMIAYIKFFHFTLMLSYHILSHVETINDCRLVIMFLTPWGVLGAFALVGMKGAVAVLLLALFLLCVLEREEELRAVEEVLVGLGILMVLGLVIFSWGCPRARRPRR